MNKIEHKLVLILDQETPRSAIDRLHTLKADGYRVEDIPADGNALMRALLTSDAEEMFQRGDYGVYFATLPRALQDSVNQRWAAPERDPSFHESRLDCGAFAIRAIRCGNVVVAVEPSRGNGNEPPSHGYLAFYAWIVDGIRAHGIVHLSNKRRPDAALCAVPQLS
jgi:cobaltochelatase CobN